ncbi:substrate-binding domain-containing protein [Scytonema sp. NUACC26]|uniref:substrate-binding domain-containing protein n=1 Tax=Scytonema sp. NUACC26 TaxID=3140176 RepID=UPI0038B283ED
MNLKSLVQATSVAATLTFGLVSVAQLGQKAFAQNTPLEGSGSTSIRLVVSDWFTERGVNYRVVGGNVGRPEFENGITDFVASDYSLPDLPREDMVVLNPVDNTIVLPYNVPSFEARLDKEQLCGIYNGTITNWSQVGGPDLPIVRVYRSDASNTSVEFDTGFIQPNCDFSITNPDRSVNFPNPNPNDLPAEASDGILDAVEATPGAIGYINRPIAISRGLRDFVFFTPLETSELAQGPIYVIFRKSYATKEKALAARDLCKYIAKKGSEVAQEEFGYTPPTEPSDSCNLIKIPVPTS